MAVISKKATPMGQKRAVKKPNVDPAPKKKTRKAIAGPKIVDPKPKRKTRKAIAGPKIVDPKPKRKTKKVIAGPKIVERPKPGGDGLTPVRRKRAMSRVRTAMARARAGNRSRRGLRR